MSKAFDNWVVGYARIIVRWRWLVALACLAGIVALAAGARNLGFSTDYRVYFGPDNPQLVAFDEIQNVYSKNDNTLFVIEPPGDDAINPQTLALTKELTDRAWQLPFALRVDSITNYQHTEAVGDDLSVADLVADTDDLDAAALRRIRTIATAEPLLVHRLISPSGHVLAVNVNFQYPGLALSEVPSAVEASRALRDELLARYPGHHIYMGGSNMMNNAFSEASKADIATLYPAMYLMLIVIMYLLLRSVSATISTVIIIVLSAAGAMGLAGYIGMDITSPSASAPIVITTLAIADSVHLLVTMFALMREGNSKTDAVVESMRLNFMPILLTSATTALGFLTINFTDSPPLKDLGNISAIGTVLAWVLSVTLLPALVCIFPIKPPPLRPTALAARMAALGTWIVEHRNAVLLATMTVSVSLLALIGQNRNDEVFAYYFDDRIQYRTDTDFMVDNITGLYTMEFSLPAPDGVADPEYLRTLDAFKQWWQQNPKVMQVSTVSDIFKRLNKNMHGDDDSWYRIPDSRELAAQYLLLYEFSLPFGLDLTNTINLDKTASRFIVVFQHLDAAETRATAEAGQQWLRDHAPEQFGYGVSPAVMFAYIAERNFGSMAIGIPVALVGISLLLILALRTFKLGMLSLIPNLLPLGMAFGLWALWDGTLNFTMAFSLGMTMGVIVDDTIHFLSKYLRARRELGLSTPDAIVYSFRTVGTALLVTSLILAGGFLILSTSAFLPNTSMSLLTVMAIVSALAADFFLLPVLLLLADRDPITTIEDNTANEPIPA